MLHTLNVCEGLAKHARDARSDVSRYNVHALVICSCPRMDNANFCYILRYEIVDR